MRKPVQHRIFLQKSNCKGLSELLSGQCTPEEALLEIADYPGLTLMRAGHIPPNPQELLTSARCKEILAALRKRFDFIILDLLCLQVCFALAYFSRHGFGGNPHKVIYQNMMLVLVLFDKLSSQHFEQLFQEPLFWP